ncbi:hypothetical protein V2J09_020742 [Rumex salicifolius]
MGLAALPSASEGVLCVILVNTAMPFTIVGHLIRAILFIFGIQLDSAFTSADVSEEENRTTLSETTYLDEFKSKTPSVRFDSVCKKAEFEGQDCSVCLTRFDPDSEINCLSCGHVFHKACLEQWMDYLNVTCPLCRTPLVGPEDDLHCSVW